MKKIMNACVVAGLCALTLASCGIEDAVKHEKKSDKVVLDNIHSRRSVRSYTQDAVEPEKVDKLIRAGMAAPSGRDARPWEIVVVNDRAILNSMAESLPYAKMLAEAPMAIVVCGNEDRSGYWYVDCSAVTQNILLAAEALGLGAVWTAAYPYPERMEPVASLLGLPDNIKPLNVIPIGYPAGDAQPKDKYDPAKIHYNKW